MNQNMRIAKQVGYFCCGIQKQTSVNKIKNIEIKKKTEMLNL